MHIVIIQIAEINFNMCSNNRNLYALKAENKTQEKRKVSYSFR